MIDYKKKYLDALERANSFQEKYGGDYAGYIFPELRESEDEKIRKFLVDYFASYKIGNVTTKLNGVRIDDILTYLEKQKEQKPAEWSEEDEWMLNVAIKSCEQTIEDYPNDKVRFKDCIAWLKSLRPQGSKDSLQTHWKPSEEQMDVLLNTEGMIRASGYPENAKVLASLYKQLKKL